MDKLEHVHGGGGLYRNLLYKMTDTTENTIFSQLYWRVVKYDDGQNEKILLGPHVFFNAFYVPDSATLLIGVFVS